MGYLMKFLSSLFLCLFLIGCSGVPLNEQSNYGVCRTYAASAPMGVGGRVGFGLITLGISEIGEANKRSKHEEAKREMARRGIGDCSVEGLARFEREKIYSDLSSADFRQCVLTTSNSIASRISSDQAKAAAAYQASQAKPNYNDRYLPKY
jgi:hypothetical protein